MRRKNRKWVAVAAGLYLFVMWSAYRWGIAQRPKDGNIFEHIERQGLRRLAEEQSKADAAAPKPTGESRLNASGPAFVAARYDDTHVVFMVAAETESRFAAATPSAEKPVRIPTPAKPPAPLAGFQELWEPDSQALHFFPEIVQQTQPGGQWSLSLSPNTTIPVVIDRAVIAPTGCSLAMGFLATVAVEQRPAFAAASQEYFVVRRKPVESEVPPAPPRKTLLSDWKASSSDAAQIERQLNERMKQEVAAIDARLLDNEGSPGATADESPVGHAQPRLREWIHVDRGLLRGDGKLDYDLRAFRLTPDAAPRLFVRARWKLANVPVFLMSAWFKAESNTEGPAPTQAPETTFKTDLQQPMPTTQSPKASLKIVSSTERSAPAEVFPILLSADSSWSVLLREGGSTGSLGETLHFQTILNVFDADHDGWAELLIHSDQGAATTITLYLYSDLGLAALKTPLRRDAQSPESCVDP